MSPSPDRPRIEAVIFDWGGTLSEHVPVDLVDVWRAAARHLAPERAEQVCARLAEIELAAWERSRADLHSFRLADLLAEASHELGLDVAEAVLEQAAAQHLDAWTPHIRHDPDCVSTLIALRERGLKIGLLSNTHWPAQFHEHFLERDGLDQLIDARLYTCDLQVRKPHPAAFLQTMHAVGCTDPARTVVVGDRLFDDIHGARQAGMRAVLRPHQENPAFDATPDAVIDRLPDLLPIVAAWQRG